MSNRFHHEVDNITESALILSEHKTMIIEWNVFEMFLFDASYFSIF